MLKKLADKKNKIDKEVNRMFDILENIKDDNVKSKMLGMIAKQNIISDKLKLEIYELIESKECNDLYKTILIKRYIEGYKASQISNDVAYSKRHVERILKEYI